MIEKKILALNLSIKQDNWLSEILGYESGQVIRKKSTPKIKLSNISFVYAKVSISDLKLFSKLCEIGFTPIDMALKFKGVLKKRVRHKKLIDIRFAKKEDEKDIIKIAMNNFLYSRFHLDPKIPNSLANNVKASWVKSFFLGKRGDEMVVAEVKKKVCGFLLIMSDENMNLVIDLICVDRKFRKKGIAQSMIHFASINSNIKRNSEEVVVGTQLFNIPSIKLYQSLGLKIFSSQFILHYHKITGS